MADPKTMQDNTQTPGTQATERSSQSWGDKYSGKALHFVRDIAVNYVFNFAISALGTYAVMRSKLNTKYLEPAIEWFVEKGRNISGSAQYDGFSRGIGNFFTRTQILLCGGHSLMPFMKWSHDNKNRLEFWMGDKLDRLQEALGKGNNATKRNIEEHKYVRDLMTAGNSANLTEQDKGLLEKYHVGNNLQFDERRQTWKQVLKARAVGTSYTTALSIVLGLSGKLPKWGQAATYEEKFGQAISEKGIKPVLKHLPGNLIEDPLMLGKNVFLELIYTFFSKLGFDHMEHRLLAKQEAEDAARAAAELKGDKESLAQSDGRGEDAGYGSRFRSGLGARQSASETRKEILNRKEKSFRLGDSMKNGDLSGVTL